MAKVKLDITVAPMGTPTPSLSAYVVAAHRVLADHPDVEAHLNPMSTTLYGELDELMAIVQKMHAAPFALDAQRVITTIRLDERRDVPTGGIADKLASVRNQLTQP